jgi:hypothetical protein
MHASLPSIMAMAPVCHQAAGPGDSRARGTARNVSATDVDRSRLLRVNDSMTNRAAPLAALAVLAAATLAACGSGSSSSASAPPSRAAASSAPASPAAAASPDCVAQVEAWTSGGGTASEGTLGNDVSALGAALQPLATAEGETDANFTAAQSASASVQADAQAVEADPGPSCVPGMAADTSTAARDYSAEAIDADNAVTQLSAGNVQGAADDINDANKQLDSGNAKIAAATADVKAYSAS